MGHLIAAAFLGRIEKVIHAAEPGEGGFVFLALSNAEAGGDRAHRREGSRCNQPSKFFRQLLG
jgi:hypothetical protein